ncbi:hypothetical protein ZIOFF_057539 [Zingiber officinale]|uniref:K Homology domain-containing protein n=1 Tax=Zingiber officinale TaxID=94328 RepID=A0A8J5KL37_ZINOF|nr:hypothetical protein ZIOFF_057539 [Zingiber officinale]
MVSPTVDGVQWEQRSVRGVRPRGSREEDSKRKNKNLGLLCFVYGFVLSTIILFVFFTFLHDHSLYLNLVLLEELPYAAAEERIVDIQGETSKALKALGAVLAHLRKFLVDHSILPLFEKSIVPPAVHDHAKEPWVDKTQSLIHSVQQTGSGKDFPVSSNLLHLENRTPVDLPYQRARLSIYGQDPSATRTPALGRTAGSLISQITQTMQIPLAYVEEIIGIGGGHISFIRRTSGAVITLEESRTVPDEIVIEIKGNSTQIQTAQRLIEDVITGHKEPASRGYSSLDIDYRSSYPSLSSSGYLSSSLSGYGSSSLGGYGAYRL